MKTLPPEVQIPTEVPIAMHPFTKYFKGFEKVRSWISSEVKLRRFSPS